MLQSTRGHQVAALRYVPIERRLGYGRRRRFPTETFQAPQGFPRLIVPIGSRSQLAVVAKHSQGSREVGSCADEQKRSSTPVV